MRVTSTVNIYDAVVGELEQAAQTALAKTAEAVHTDVVQAQVMPRDTGTLQNESTYVDLSELSLGKASLVSSTPYARRLYYHPEYHFSTVENPNAKGRWLESYVSGKKQEFVKDTFEKLFKKESGM